jgi:hypothetical protein
VSDVRFVIVGAYAVAFREAALHENIDVFTYRAFSG